MQKNLLPKFVELLKIGLIVITVICSTSEAAVGRTAEEETESTSGLKTPPTTDAINRRQRASTPDIDASETPEENQRYTQFGLFNRNPFDNSSASKHFIWQSGDQPSSANSQQETEHQDPATDSDHLIQPYLDSLRRWRNPPHLTDLSQLHNWKPRRKRDEEGIALPMDSNLKITVLQSVTIEANKTHYFGEGDLNRYGRYGYGGYGSYASGLDLGLTSSYGYEDFGYNSSGFGGGYGSGFGSGYSSSGSGYSSGYGSGGVPRATGFNLRQIQQFGLHGRVGQRTHIAIDYSAGGSGLGSGGYGGYGGGYGIGGTKEQKIKIWYEGTPDSIIKTISFGDITLSLPNTRFLNINRNLFGIEGVFEWKNARLTAFGSRSKGIREVRTFRGQSRRAGGGYGYGPRGIQIQDTNYVKNRFYHIHRGEDGALHEAYLPIKSGSEQLYIDDGVVGNNQGGKRTSRGYFNPQFAGQDYNIDYETGEIEFLTPISASYTIVVAYEYLGSGGGSVGKPEGVFVDENGDGTLDEEGEEVGYVVLKEKGFRGTEATHVYSLGNRNINPRDFTLIIRRQGQSETFQTSSGPAPYIEIFGLDQNGDGNVDAQFIDYDRGILRFPRTYGSHPFQITDPNHPYYAYRDTLSNNAIYLEGVRTDAQIYTIIADYAYQSETYNVGLFVIPNSETVRLNGRLLTRDTDYMMLYEVGTLRFFRQLDEFDEIVVEFEKTPFGGSSQQAVVGAWLEYTHKPKPKSGREQSLEDRFNRLGGMQTIDATLGTGAQDAFGETFPGGSGGRFGRSSFGGGFGRSSFGEGFSGGYNSFGGLGGRSRSYGSYGGTMNYFNPVFQKGFALSTGYILNTGQNPAEIPDVNGTPNRLQAVNVNTSFGREFNIAGLFNLLPFIHIQNFPLSLDFSGEAAYSHNNPNSIGVALIDSMEGAKEATTVPTLKYNWKHSSLPYTSQNQTTSGNPSDYQVIPSNENRAIFSIVLKDKNEAEAIGNYMRNRDVPASSIQPLSLSTEERLIMELGYDFRDVVAEWGGFSNGLSASGVDYSERGFLEIWLRVQGDDNVTLHLNLGVVNEDTDEDKRLDSEDLPNTLIDTNGDGSVDALDLDLENLSEVERYRGNGALDTGEDVGWNYDGPLGGTSVGEDNQILDSEDLNGDGVLDATDAYFEISIPLNDIPNEWIKSKNANGWRFLSIPLSKFTPTGSRLPSLVFVQHFRFWLSKNAPGNAQGTLQWASIEIVGNKWQQGIITRSGSQINPEIEPTLSDPALTSTSETLSTSTIVEDTLERFTVGTKDNFSYDDYQNAYLDIEDNELFKKLHPFTATSLGFQTQQQREQTLSLAYYLFPGSYGVTSKQLKGLTQSEGQDFSKHDTLRFWLYGDKSDTTFVLQLAPTVRTGYRSAFYSSDPFVDQTQKEDVNVFENLTDYYEYTVPIDFDGWKLIEIDLRDLHRNTYPDVAVSSQPLVGTHLLPATSANGQQPTVSASQPIEDSPDGHPDGFAIRGGNSTRLSIKNIGGILLGIRNDTEREISGEIWVNEIHLGDPLVRAGWARRGNMSVGLGNSVKLRGGYASQDKDFESGAGEVGRQRLSSRGYSTTNNDYNIDADVTLFPWLPIRYAIRQQETETERQRGSYSSFQSGKSEIRSRDFSVQFNRNPFPNLGFAYNYQDFWNERQGTQISHLYTGTFGYDLGSKLGVNAQYRHEDILAQPETATDTASASSSIYSYGYGRNRDEKTDSGTITLNISPTNIFSLSPTYDISRTLERREDPTGINVAAEPETAEPEAAAEPGFSIAQREHRLSLTPRLNRDLFGMRPTATSRMSFRENWFSEEKNASLNGNVSLGMNLRLEKWFGWLLNGRHPSAGSPQQEDSKGTIGNSPKDIEGTETSLPQAESYLQALRENSIDETQIQALEEKRGDWIERDKTATSNQQEDSGLSGNIAAESQQPMGSNPQQQDGILNRMLKSFTVSTNANFTATESYRRLASGQSIIEIYSLAEDAKERTNSRRSNRYTLRSSVEPWKWASLGANVSTSDSFRKSSGSIHTSHAESYETDLKLTARETTSFQLRYSFTKRDNTTQETTLSDSSAHTPSLSWIHTWGKETRTALGIRTTFREQQRSGIQSNAFIVTPNLSIDYRYHTENGIRLPFLGRIPLKHDLELTNTLSWAIRREHFAANREERSERYETTLRVGYKISTHITANFHLGVSYNHDRVEEGRDFLSIASALTVRGEIQ